MGFLVGLCFSSGLRRFFFLVKIWVWCLWVKIWFWFLERVAAKVGAQFGMRMGGRRLGNESLVSLVRFGVLYFRALQHLSMEKFKKGVRGCLGCCTKPTPIIAVDEPTKGLKIQGRTVKKPSLSEDFWSTSTYEMENSGVQSQRSISSISTLYPAHDSHSAGGSSSNPPEFVNHGFLLWTQTRQQWIGNKKTQNQTPQVREPKLSWNATYDSLLGTNKPFPQPIRLSEMVDFLVDVWEQEGMYD